MKQIEDLHRAMPLFHEHLDLYPSSARLRYALRDVFEDYIDYYIKIIKHLRRKPIGTS